MDPGLMSNYYWKMARRVALYRKITRTDDPVMVDVLANIRADPDKWIQTIEGIEEEIWTITRFQYQKVAGVGNIALYSTKHNVHTQLSYITQWAIVYILYKHMILSYWVEFVDKSFDDLTKM